MAPQKDLCPPKIVLKREKSCFQFKSDGKNKPVTITRPVTDPIGDILRKNSDFMTNKWLHHHPMDIIVTHMGFYDKEFIILSFSLLSS